MYLKPQLEKKSSLKRVTGQRVLTSTEGLALLKEKEDKKLIKFQEIEQRKKDREKKKERLSRQKAEEKRKKKAVAVRKRLITSKRTWKTPMLNIKSCPSLMKWLNLLLPSY